MKKRSKEFLRVGFYLSKFGEMEEDDKYPLPPKRLGVNHWNEAYRIFYEKLHDGRTVLAFERSLKNARDSFDSHLTISGRIGWRGDKREPSPLSVEAQQVYDELINKKEEEVWKLIVNYSDVAASNYSSIFEDLIGMEESEKEENLSKTEGGLKVVISNKIERKPSLKRKAIQIHGVDCMVCGFNFEKTYGKWGKEFIEVHHLKPLGELEGKQTETNPKSDLAVLCSNCHRMIHRKKGMTLTIEELKRRLINRLS